MVELLSRVPFQGCGFSRALVCGSASARASPHPPFLPAPAPPSSLDGTRHMAHECVLARTCWCLRTRPGRGSGYTAGRSATARRQPAPQASGCARRTGGTGGACAATAASRLCSRRPARRRGRRGKQRAVGTPCTLDGSSRKSVTRRPAPQLAGPALPLPTATTPRTHRLPAIKARLAHKGAPSCRRSTVRVRGLGRRGAPPAPAMLTPGVQRPTLQGTGGPSSSSMPGFMPPRGLFPCLWPLLLLPSAVSPLPSRRCGCRWYGGWSALPWAVLMRGRSSSDSGCERGAARRTGRAPARPPPSPPAKCGTWGAGWRWAAR